MKSIALL